MRGESTYKFAAPDRKVPKRFRIEIIKGVHANHRYYADAGDASSSYLSYIMDSVLCGIPASYKLAELDGNGRYAVVCTYESSGGRSDA